MDTALHHELYDMLLDYADLQVEVESVVWGYNWVLCQAGSSGLAPSVAAPPSWRGALYGRQLGELATWLSDWDRSRAAVGLAAVNAALNREADIVTANGAIFSGDNALHHSIEWFQPMLRGKQVAQIGPRLQPLKALQSSFHLHQFHSEEGSLHPAYASVLQECDWVFVNACTIADKTLPQILHSAAGSRVVLYGGGVPWLDEWQQFGVDYLLGCEIDQPSRLHALVAEGQDVEQGGGSLHFRLINMQPELSVIPPAKSAPLRRVATG